MVKNSSRYVYWAFVSIIFLASLILLILGKAVFAYYGSLLFLSMIILYIIHFIYGVPKVYSAFFVVMGLLSALGGALHIDGTRLYDTYFWIIKWDMFLHFSSLFIITLTLYFIFGKTLNIKNKSLLIFISMLGAISGGALFEIYELFSIYAFGNDGIGDYFNNAWDLVLNLLGTLVAAAWIWFRNHRES